MREVKARLPEGLYKLQEAKYRITLLNPDGSERSVIQFKSAEDPRLLRGDKVSFFVIDEAAKGVPYESFVSIMTTVTQTYGRGLIISTPEHRGWFYDLYQRGDKSRLLPGEVDPWPEFYSLRMPTWINPHVPLASIQDAKKNLPAQKFAEEYAAVFMSESAGVFQNIAGCVRPYVQFPEPYQPGHNYVAGVDLARLRDYSVITIIDVNTKRVVYWERFNDVAWEMQYMRIIRASRDYRARVVLDSTGIGDPIYQTLVGMGVNIDPYKIGTSEAKKQLIDNLRVCLEQETITYPKLPILIDELERYEYKQTESGVVKFQAPSGRWDDCVISLALAAWEAAKSPWIYHFYNARGV